MRCWIYPTLWVLVGLPMAATPAVCRQSTTAAPLSLEQRADKAYQAQEWAKAADGYRKISHDRPDDTRVWYRLAVCLRRTGEYAGAKQALEEGATKGLPSSLVDFELTLLYAAMNDSKRAFEWLDKALEAGFAQVDRMASDSELAVLREDPRFVGALEHAKKDQKPCAYMPENRQFDFWVGSWDVVTTGGETPAGTNQVDLILGDCVLLENWTGRGGDVGKSFNLFNSAKQRWEQTWVDARGGTVFFYGRLEQGVMDYWTEDIPAADSSRLRRHLRFFNLGPDRVRQLSEASTDEGRTWKVQYDLTYIRKK